MTTLASKVGDIQAALDTLTKQHRVPGASVGVLQGDELVEVASGVANRNTEARVTTRTLFQIGSNTKVYTATLAMQLIDEGLIERDYGPHGRDAQAQLRRRSRTAAGRCGTDRAADGDDVAVARTGREHDVVDAGRGARVREAPSRQRPREERDEGALGRVGTSDAAAAGEAAA